MIEHFISVIGRVGKIQLLLRRSAGVTAIQPAGCREERLHLTCIKVNTATKNSVLCVLLCDAFNASVEAIFPGVLGGPVFGASRVFRYIVVSMS